jgi:hypothetical protein
MSSSESLLHPDEQIEAGSGVKKLRNIGYILGALVLGGAAFWGSTLGDDLQRFLHSYLVAFTYFTSMAVGALFFVIVMHLMGAKWSVVMRRVAECITRTFPVLWVLSAAIWVPMLMGNDSLYIWSNPEFVKTSHLVHAKHAYLNDTFFAIRINIYFAVWSLVSWYFYRTSVKQDESGDEKLTSRMIKLSAPAMFAFAFTTAFYGFDLLMSIDPEWFSTMFGLVYFAGCAISIFSLMVIIPAALQRGGVLKHSITKEHYHDIGKLLFAFVFFWGYVAFSQFMLIWGANIPEETAYFMKRWFTAPGSETMGQWGQYTLLMIGMHFVVPFVLLMSRYGKRRIGILTGFAVYMLVFHYMDLYWQIMPALSNHDPFVEKKTVVFQLFSMDMAVVVGMGLLFIGAVAGALAKVRLIPIKDPGLAQSLKFENQ